MDDTIDIEEIMRKKKAEESKKNQVEKEEDEKSLTEGDIDVWENDLGEEVKYPQKEPEDIAELITKNVESETKKITIKKIESTFEANPEFYLRRLEDRYQTILGDKTGETMIQEIHEMAKQLNIIK